METDAVVPVVANDDVAIMGGKFPALCVNVTDATTAVPAQIVDPAPYEIVTFRTVRNDCIAAVN